ncbi:hypothetical protein MUK42_22847 [Musa troglodytarum]|uniref:Uncharacterized protein n=1 Tax=Musa troglodytarum TaxID=320322 RepID=A0A9E7I4F5_9LILI|nr:hypothetical protein MUK42_22847 [Musa troglodytarum]
MGSDDTLIKKQSLPNPTLGSISQTHPIQFQIRSEHLLDEKTPLIQVRFQCFRANHAHRAIDSSGVPPAAGPHSYTMEKEVKQFQVR